MAHPHQNLKVDVMNAMGGASFPTPTNTLIHRYAVIAWVQAKSI